MSDLSAEVEEAIEEARCALARAVGGLSRALGEPILRSLVALVLARAEKERDEAQAETEQYKREWARATAEQEVIRLRTIDDTANLYTAALARAEERAEEDKLEWYAAVKSMRDEADRADKAEERVLEVERERDETFAERDHFQGVEMQFRSKLCASEARVKELAEALRAKDCGCVALHDHRCRNVKRSTEDPGR